MRLSRQGSRFQSYELLNITPKTKYKTSRTKVVELPTTKVRVQFTMRGTFLSPSFISFVKKQLDHQNVLLSPRCIWTDKGANIRVQKSIDYREFRVKQLLSPSLNGQKQQQQQGERLGTFPDPNLECNSGYARDVSTFPHLSSVSMSLAPWRSLTHRDTWEMGSYGIFRCQEFVVSIAGWFTWGAFGGVTELLWNAESWVFPEWIFKSHMMNPWFDYLRLYI